MVEEFEHEGVEAVADDAAVVRDAADAGNPDDNEEAGEIDGEGDTVVFGTEDFDGEKDEENGNGIGAGADEVEEGLVDGVEDGAAMAKPGNYGEDGKRKHQNGDDLAPKTTGEFVRGLLFPGVFRGFPLCF